ncbi:HxxPF-repeated domain-containing protein [Lentzea waywayandensis]|uniref:HxxPF-repeated domain-containing protein n=1 Tax=Lentzea waywayandensis TaxID=84724 RepID=A0A1I6FD96_9PSEU|nr:HxxPF-repeated domain-containing protein [Lentzea waywayandensis]
MVLRTDTSGNINFLHLIERVREVDLAAFAHQDVPFEKVVEEVNPVRVQHGLPLSEIFFRLGSQHRPTKNLAVAHGRAAG